MARMCVEEVEDRTLRRRPREGAPLGGVVAAANQLPDDLVLALLQATPQRDGQVMQRVAIALQQEDGQRVLGALRRRDASADEDRGAVAIAERADALAEIGGAARPADQRDAIGIDVVLGDDAIDQVIQPGGICAPAPEAALIAAELFWAASSAMLRLTAMVRNACTMR